MSIRRPTQFELFPASAVSDSPKRCLADMFKELTLNLEHIIILLIILLMVNVVCFSFGVERGKRLIRMASHSAPKVKTGIAEASSVGAADMDVPSIRSGNVLVRERNISPAALNQPRPVINVTNAPAMAVQKNEIRKVVLNDPRLATAKISAVTKPVQNQNPPAVVVNKPPAVQEVKPVIQQGLYTIQIASYKSKDIAQREILTLRQKGVEGFIVVKGEYLIVCVGKYNAKSDAEKVLSKVKSKYKDALIRRI